MGANSGRFISIAIRFRRETYGRNECSFRGETIVRQGILPERAHSRCLRKAAKRLIYKT